jgi:BNR-Asp box repeat protein
VVASNFDEGTVYVAQDGYRNDDFAPYLWRSKDYGKTWESLAAGLPAEPVNVVQEDPRAAHLLFVGTDMGVFVSLDRGKTWDVLSSGLPRVPVHDLVVQPRDGDLVVATHGRSVFVADVTSLRRLRAPLTEVTSLRAFPVKSAQADLRRGYGENPWTAWSREEPLVRINFWSKSAGTAELRIKDAAGNVWKELSTPAQPGLNVVEYDLSADPAKADVAEEAARKAALEKEKAKPPAAEAGRREGATDENEEEAGGDTEDRAGRGDEEAGGGRGAPAAAPKPLDDELKQLLADPLRASRRRYLAAGTYTVEIRSGSATATTSLRVRPPRGERQEDATEEDESRH